MLGRWVEDHEVVHNIMFNTTTNEKIFYKKALTRSEWWDNGVLPLWITAQNQVNNYSVFSVICKFDICDNRWNGVNIFFPKIVGTMRNTSYDTILLKIIRWLFIFKWSTILLDDSKWPTVHSATEELKITMGRKSPLHGMITACYFLSGSENCFLPLPRRWSQL